MKWYRAKDFMGASCLAERSSLCMLHRDLDQMGVRPRVGRWTWGCVSHTRYHQWMSKQTKLAYLAGIIDGEGHLAMQNPGKGHGRPRPQIEVSSIDKELIEYLHAEHGGFMPRPREKDGRKTEYRWRVNGAQARELLAGCSPYMRIDRKRERAESMC